MPATDSNDATPHKRCLGCGYILDGLPENRCPECGREFDPDNPASYLSRLHSGRPYLVAAVCGAVAIAIPLLGAYLADLGVIHLKPVSALVMMPLMLLGLMTETVVLDKSLRVLRGPVAVIKNRRAAVAALAISGAMVLGFGGVVILQLVLRIV